MTNTVPPLATAAIDARSLRKTYPKDVVALDGLDLTVPTGTVFAVLGPNGAGKTTAVKILTTLSDPDEGTAMVAGIDVLARPDEVRRAIGYVAQRSGADPQATGIENLTLQARVHGIDRSRARQRSAELLQRFGLAEAADRTVKTWSGGMRRRLDIALALVHDPVVIFLDEPTTGLDPDVRSDLWNEIRRLRDDDEVTVLLTTHYLEEADRLADRLVIVDHGRVVAAGTPSDLKDAMRGDGIHIDLGSPAAAASAVPLLEGSNGLYSVAADGRTVHARAEHGAGAVPRVVAALDAAGITVEEISVTRPSLDDVFLSHTGRRIDAEDTEVAA
jgi:ABC-2 type transport system ATP-binding protein